MKRTVAAWCASVAGAAAAIAVLRFGFGVSEAVAIAGVGTLVASLGRRPRPR